MDFSITVIGFRRGCYVNKSGIPVRYTRIFATRHMEEKADDDAIVCGSSCDILFIPRDVEVNVGDQIVPIYNKYGSCVDLIKK